MGITLAETILDKDTLYSGHSPAMDLRYGGQTGFMPRIGLLKDNKNYGEWINNQAYIRRNVIPVLLQSPRFFDFLPDSTKWVSVWKSVIEDQPLTIDGLTSGLSVDTDSHAVGGAGEEQEEITNVTRAKSTLSMTFQDKAGKSLIKLFDFYIRYGMMDPDTKSPLVTRYFSKISDIGNMYTPDFYSSTVMYIEPDITNKVVNDAWLCTNVFPKSNGERTGKRDIKAGGEKVELNIDWSCITMNNEAVLRLADIILANLTVLKKIPDLDLVLPVDGQTAKVQAVSEFGFNRNGHNANIK